MTAGIVWDASWDDSLKKQECKNMGELFPLLNAVSSSKLPCKWTSFLWVGENNTELFPLPNNQVVLIEGDKLVYITDGENVLTSDE